MTSFMVLDLLLWILVLVPFMAIHLSGGVAILWRAEVDAMVTPIDLDIDWMCGVEERRNSK